MNHDEYSLVYETEQEEIENKPNFGTLTLKKKKEGDKERDAKMEQLKKKLRTDDESKYWKWTVIGVMRVASWCFIMSLREMDSKVEKCCLVSYLSDGWQVFF